jgi:hypothetical protein
MLLLEAPPRAAGRGRVMAPSTQLCLQVGYKQRPPGVQAARALWRGGKCAWREELVHVQSWPCC